MEKPNEESQESSVNNWDGLYRSMKKFSKETQEGVRLAKEKSRLAKEEQEKRDNEIMAKLEKEKKERREKEEKEKLEAENKAKEEKAEADKKEQDEVSKSSSNELNWFPNEDNVNNYLDTLRYSDIIINIA